MSTVDGGDSILPSMTTTSTLVIENVRASDTGAYRCASAAGESLPTDIHVITGEERVID